MSFTTLVFACLSASVLISGFGNHVMFVTADGPLLPPLEPTTTTTATTIAESTTSAKPTTFSTSTTVKTTTESVESTTTMWTTDGGFTTDVSPSSETTTIGYLMNDGSKDALTYGLVGFFMGMAALAFVLLVCCARRQKKNNSTPVVGDVELAMQVFDPQEDVVVWCRQNSLLACQSEVGSDMSDYVSRFHDFDESEF